MDRLTRFNVVATSGRAVEAAGDVDVRPLDKTGTITLGNRQAVGFIAAPGVAERDLIDAALLAEVRARAAAFPAGGPVPAGSATGSGSGLDPHVSPATALAQHVEGRVLRLVGERRVNVLRLNLAFAELQ